MYVINFSSEVNILSSFYQVPRRNHAAAPSKLLALITHSVRNPSPSVNIIEKYQRAK